MLKKIKQFSAVLITAALFFAGCGEVESPKEANHKEELHNETIILPKASIKEIGLQTERVSLKPHSGFITIPAKVLANQDYEAQVGSLVQGRVFKVFANVGNYVKAGQELMLVEGLEIGVIKAAYLTAKANLEFQKANYERQKILIDQNVGSQKSFLEAQAEYDKAIAEFNAEDKKIHSIGLDDKDVTNGKRDHSLDHTSGTLTVNAPISGIVVERNVVIGQLVDNTTNAFKIINISSVWIDGQIYEKDINKINEKTTAEFTASTYPNELFNGRITYIGQVIDEKSRTITIRAEFNNPKGKLKPQMFGEMKISTGKNSMAILIPAESIVKINNEDFVFVQRDNSIETDSKQEFEKRSVVIGSIQDDIIEIIEGLNVNDKVVVKGVFYLKSELMKSELEGDEH